MIRLNLLPKNLRRRVEPGWWRLLALLFALVVLGVLGLVHYTAYTELSLAKAERDQLQAEVEALRPFIAELGRLQEERKALEALLAIREGLEKNAVPWSQYLAAFINQIPRAGGRLEVALRSVSARALSEEEAARPGPGRHLRRQADPGGVRPPGGGPEPGGPGPVHPGL